MFEALVRPALHGDIHRGVVTVDAAYFPRQRQGRRTAEIEAGGETHVPALKSGAQEVEIGFFRFFFLILAFGGKCHGSGKREAEGKKRAEHYAVGLGHRNMMLVF